MKAPIEYLESAKIQDLAEEMRADGFSVRLSPDTDVNGYDLVAEKNGRRIAVDVKAQSRLREAAPQISRHRRQARDSGFDEFRLVVVNPPREKRIHVEGLEAKLAAYLQEHVPADLQVLSSQVQVTRVKIDLDQVEIASQEMEFGGTGLIGVTLLAEPSSGQDTLVETDFPFEFTVLLNTEKLAITRLETKVDTSGY